MTTFAPTDLPGVLVVTPVVHGDARGFFMERWREGAYLAHGIGPFVQDNHSRSDAGIVRGLHWQIPPHAQGKLVSVVRGSIFDVAVDLRLDSPTLGRWTGVVLDDVDHRQLWIPPGFAHGFAVLDGPADVYYKSTEVYAPTCERGLRWDDPDLAIDWPLRDTPTTSARDLAWPRYGDLEPGDLFSPQPAAHGSAGDDE